MRRSATNLAELYSLLYEPILTLRCNHQNTLAVALASDVQVQVAVVSAGEEFSSVAHRSDPYLCDEMAVHDLKGRRVGSRTRRQRGEGAKEEVR